MPATLLPAPATATLSPNPAIGVAAVLLGAFISALNTRLTSFGLADLRGGLGLSFDEGAWLTTLFSAPQLLVAPATAYVARAIGARRILVPSIIGFLLTSAILPLLSNPPAILATQALRGLAVGTFLPACLTFVLQALPPRTVIWGLAAYGFDNIVAGHLAASLEGFWSDAGAWEWIIWQNLPLTLVMLALTHVGMALPPVNREALRQTDWGGPLLLGAGLALVYAGLDQGNRLDWLHSGVV